MIVLFSLSTGEMFAQRSDIRGLRPSPSALGKTIVSTPANADSTKFKWIEGDAAAGGATIFDANEAGVGVDSIWKAYGVQNKYYALGQFEDFADGAPWDDGANSNIGLYYSPYENGEFGLKFYDPHSGLNNKIDVRGSSWRADKYPASTYARIFLSDSGSFNFAGNNGTNFSWGMQNSKLVGFNGTTYAEIHMGAGSPEGVVYGFPGSIYMNTSGGTGTTLYVFEGLAPDVNGWVAK